MSDDYLGSALEREQSLTLLTWWFQATHKVIGIPDMETAREFFNKMIDPEGGIVFDNLAQMVAASDMIRKFLFDQGKTIKDLCPGCTDDQVECMIDGTKQRLFPELFKSQWPGTGNPPKLEIF